jgi:hypothetical protein
MDASNNLFILDEQKSTVRVVSSLSMAITLYAGGGSAGLGDGGPATDAQLNYPQAIAVDSSGVLYIADTRNCRIRRVGRSGVITTYAGTGQCSNDGDGGAATSAMFLEPRAVTVDSLGSVFVADKQLCMDGCTYFVRMIDPSTGIIRHSQTALNINYLATDGSAQVYYTDDAAVRTLGMEIVAGQTTGNTGSGGDEGPATGAYLSTPTGIAFDASGNMYVADRDNHRVRLVTVDWVYPPTVRPTPSPTRSPTLWPSAAPTHWPSRAPTGHPTLAPTRGAGTPPAPTTSTTVRAVNPAPSPSSSKKATVKHSRHTHLRRSSGSVDVEVDVNVQVK